jgi:hypothetical protein
LEHNGSRDSSLGIARARGNKFFSSAQQKQLGSQVDHSPPSSTEVKNGGATPPLLHMSSWRGAQLIKHLTLLEHNKRDCWIQQAGTAYHEQNIQGSQRDCGFPLSIVLTSHNIFCCDFLKNECMKTVKEISSRTWSIKMPSGVSRQKLLHAPFKQWAREQIPAFRTTGAHRMLWILCSVRHKAGCKIWGFHVGDYDECRLLGCGAV